MSEIDVTYCKFARLNDICANPINIQEHKCSQIPIQMCYYKQLQVAIEENERLKEQIEPCYNPKTGEVEGYLYNITDDFLKSTKLEQENRELKEKMNKINDIAHWRMGDVDIHYQNRLKQIQKLSEV